MLKSPAKYVHFLIKSQKMGTFYMLFCCIKGKLSAKSMWCNRVLPKQKRIKLSSDSDRYENRRESLSDLSPQVQVSTQLFFLLVSIKSAGDMQLKLQLKLLRKLLQPRLLNQSFFSLLCITIHFISMLFYLLVFGKIYLDIT